MIGMIALAGIVTRDSIILVDFIELAIRHGRPLFDAILESLVVRLRPILLTAGAALLSSVPITLEPIFSGLGWSLIFGLIASTGFTQFVIPVSYWLLKANRDTTKNHVIMPSWFMRHSGASSGEVRVLPTIGVQIANVSDL